MRVTIPDDVADTYAAYAQPTGQALDTVVTQQLKRFARLAPSKRAIVLGAAAIETLEARLGGLPLQDDQDLVARVARLAGVAFMGLDLRLSPGQLDELVTRAERQGKSVDQVILDIWAVLVNEFFYAGGGGEAVVPVGGKASAA
jgi:hypothetical protein